MANVLEQLQQRLRRRVEYVASSNWKFFHARVCLLHDFLQNDTVLNSLLEELIADFPTERTADQVVAALKHNGAVDTCSEDDEAFQAFRVIQHCRGNDDPVVERNITHNLVQYPPSNDGYQQQAHCFFDAFIRPLHLYLEDRLDTKRFILGMLRRYKLHCEWFRRNDLLSIFTEEKARSATSGKKSRGEKRLALHLYEFLHLQGLSFSIEPASISGEADLVSAQDSDDPLIADVKVFDPQSGKNKAYLISGFHQVYQYTLDYNESFGYLVIFKTCEEGLAFSFGQQEQSTSFVTFNGKTIFFIVIDLFAHEKSASQRGKLKSYVITEQELVTQHVDTEMPQAAPHSDDSEQATGKGGQQ